MKKILFFIVALTLVFSLSACSKSFTNISNEELREMLDSDIDYYFIDVRTQEEFYTERIPGFTLNVDYYILDVNHDLISELDRSRPVVIMCNSGNRSVSASYIFLEEGFDEVYNLEFGIEGWDGETE
jgi:rhodanese-related sulfurtransferase